MDSETRRHLALDARLVRAAREVRVLSAISWSAADVEVVLAAVEGRGDTLPTPRARRDHSAVRAELDAVVAECDGEHPLGRHVSEGARSVLCAVDLIENVGTPAFGRHARLLYGSPSDRLIPRLRGSTVTAARHLLERTAALAASCTHDEADYCVVAEAVADQIRSAAHEMFGPDAIVVEVDPDLASKAAAGAGRVRVRGATCFSALDGPQLVQHELLVHTLTARNGRQQPHLQSLGVGLPRTTRTQEGLAVFAEFVTGTMDLARLRRIVARVVGIAMALDGADVVEVARFFVTTGQTVREAVHSAARIFRGTDCRGGAAFTKDVVYLQGFVRIHDFLCRALVDCDVPRIHRLFAGRLTTGDVLRLAGLFDAGIIVPAERVPPWARSRGILAAFLTYDTFIREMRVGQMSPSAE